MNKRTAITFIFLILGPTIYGMKPKDQEKPQYERYTFPSCAEKFIDGFMTGKLTGDRGYSFATEEKHYRRCFANLGEEAKEEVLEGSRDSDEREVLARELRVDLSGQLTTKYFMREVRIVKNKKDLEGRLHCSLSRNLLDELRTLNLTKPIAQPEVHCHLEFSERVPCGDAPAYRAYWPERVFEPSCYADVDKQEPINPAIIPALEALHVVQEKLRNESHVFRENRSSDPLWLNLHTRIRDYLRRRAEQKASHASQQN